MENLIVIESCPDGSCCCLPARSSVVFISLLSMIVSWIDILSADCECDGNSAVKNCVDTLKFVLITLFQLANAVLLVATVTESPYLVGVYISYTLGFIVLGLCVSLLDLLLRYEHEGAKGLVSFVSETVFLFVISRCLPLIDGYRKNLLMEFK